MRPTAMPGALLAAMLLTGCLGLGGAPEPAAAPVEPHPTQGLDPATGLPAGVPTRLHFGPCEELFAFHPLPMQDAEAVMPPGFAPLPMDPAGQLAVAVAVGFSCEAIAGDAGFTHGEARTLAVVLAVEPPEAYSADHVQYYALALGGFASTEELAAVYQAWNLGEAHVAPVDFTFAAAPGPAGMLARTGRAAASDGTLGLELRVDVAAEEAQEPNAFRIFAVDPGRGEVQAAVDWAWPAGARAMEHGAASLVVEGTLPGLPWPVHPGLGKVYWGDYSYDLTYLPVAALVPPPDTSGPGL